jgi:hypothetical protein
MKLYVLVFDVLQIITYLRMILADRETVFNEADNELKLQIYF